MVKPGASAPKHEQHHLHPMPGAPQSVATSQSCHLIAEVAVDQETGEDAEEAGFEDAKQVLLLQSRPGNLTSGPEEQGRGCTRHGQRELGESKFPGLPIGRTNIRKGHGNLHAGP